MPLCSGVSPRIIPNLRSRNSSRAISTSWSVSENTARMRVERALDKIAVSLRRRGITSTGASVGLSIGGQIATAAPLSLASLVTGSAVNVAALSVLPAFLAFLGTAKVNLGTTAAIVAVATGSGVAFQEMRIRDAEAAVVRTYGERQALESKVGQLTTQIAQVQQRADEAEKGNDELLKAVAAVSKAEDVSSKTRAPKVAAKLQDEERLQRERKYQQDLARTRAEEAIARANVDAAVSTLDPASKYRLLIASSEKSLANQ